MMAWAMFPYFDLSNLIMVYLLGVVGVAATSGPGPASLAAVLSVAAFDFFFVPPYFSFAVVNTQYLVTFGVMLIVALMIGHLTIRIRWHAEAARQRERRTASLYALSRELAGTRGVPGILQAAVRQIAEVFRVRSWCCCRIHRPPGPGRRICRGDSRWTPPNSLSAGGRMSHTQMAGMGPQRSRASKRSTCP